MSKKAIKYIAALLAIFFCTAAFSISSFAPHIAVISAKGETDGVIPGSKPSSKSVSSEIVSSKIVSSKPVSSSSDPTDLSKDPEDTKKPETSYSPRKHRNTALPSKRPATTVSSENPKSAGSVDTKQQQVNNAANEAEQATNDPGTLSSQDWSALLNSSEVSSESSDVSSSLPQVAAATDNGFPNMLIIGIILVVAGLAGIGVFIYLQFIRKPGRLGGKSEGGPVAGQGNDMNDTAVFTDISSYSDGKCHNDMEKLRNENDGGGNADIGATEKDEGNSGNNNSAAHHINAQPPARKPQPQPPARKPQPKPQPEDKASEKRKSRLEASDDTEETQYFEKAHAKPVGSEKSDFDWEKYFKDNQ